MNSTNLLGPLESEVMGIMWEVRLATVRQITDTLAMRRPIAYTTVMTVMNNLVHKGLLQRTAQGKAFIYAPAMSQEQFLKHKSQEAVNDVLNRFGSLAIAQFMEAMADASPEQLERLKELGSEPQDAPAEEESH